ncbi:uncharacterized protein [Macrobrachium rosenbergii]|uniref:uncharacterized protein n=1 Tax=Macrobrachium rosenbergii TaxID=79674 RepID=UPI0034D6C014
METNQSVLSAVDQGDWMVMIDIQDAYFHIPFHLDSRKYLRLAFQDRAFQFQAPRVGRLDETEEHGPVPCTRALPPPLWHVAIYKEGGKNLRKAAECIESKVGSIPIGNLKRFFNTLKGVVYSKDLHVFKEEEILHRCPPCVSHVKKLGGDAAILLTFSSNYLPIPSLLAMRGCSITPQIKEVLQWWLVEDRFSTGRSLAPTNRDLTLYSDTLDLGWGALLNNMEVSGTWSPSKRNLHINVKELKVIHLALQHFATLTFHETVVVHSDSMTALAYIKNEGGTHSFTL